MIEHPIIIAIDPGKMTGVAVVERDRWGVTESGVILRASIELDEDTIITWLRMQLDSLGAKPYVIVMETFVINARTVSNSQAPWSLMTIGAVQQVCRDYGYPVENIKWQSPSNAKNVVPNEKLKRLGTWHKGGAGHANDAIRHAVLYAISTGFRSPALVRGD
jgi:hypothetical protein